MFGDECLGSPFKLNASESRGRGHGRGNELCSYTSKVQSHQSHRKLHDTQPNTRSHELKLESLKTRLGLSVFLSLF
jgi:hypothetical protein